MKPSRAIIRRILTGWVMVGFAASAGPLSLDAVVFSGGGGPSRSARFGVDGSIGQGVAESDASESGGLGLRAGFWSQVIPWMDDSGPEDLRIQVELVDGAPLRVRLRATAIPGRTYTLQSAGALGGPWSTLARPVAAGDGSLVFSETLGLDVRFYRLAE